MLPSIWKEEDMKWINRMKSCIDYIEENLKGEIDIGTLSRLTFLSKRYFLIMFEAVTGMTVHEYIRKRRMSVAAYELMEKHRKVIDVAFDFGYSSAEAFSRAFKNIHGVSPANTGKNGSYVKLYAPISFHIEIKGEESMNYRVEKKEAFKVFGKSISTTSEDGRNFKEIPRFWKDVFESGLFKEMIEYCDEGSKNYGVCLPMKNEDEFDYVIGFSGSRDDYGKFQVFEIPEAKWVIFECRGAMPNAMQDVWKRIFKEWLPATEYEIDFTKPELELYTEGDASSEEYYSEIWVPLKGE